MRFDLYFKIQIITKHWVFTKKRKGDRDEQQ